MTQYLNAAAITDAQALVGTDFEFHLYDYELALETWGDAFRLIVSDALREKSDSLP